MTDCIVVGGGANGLAAATSLARRGRSVTLLERRDLLGGVAALEEFHPGYRVPGLLHDTGLVRPALVETLGLDLEWRDPVPVLTPPGFVLRKDAVAGDDAEAYARWRAFLGRVGGFLRGLLDGPPPRIDATGGKLLLEVLRRGFQLRRLGGDDMLEVLRVPPMCVADWLNEHFTDDRLKASLAILATGGTWMGPWSAGSAANLLLHEALAGREVRGGPAGFTAALEKAARAAGVTIRTGAAVRRVLVEDGSVRGVELEEERLDAPAVLATCDPKRTFLQLMDPVHVPSDLARAIRRFRTRGTTAKVHLALRGPLPLDAEALRIASSVDDVERAFDGVKYGEAPGAPALDVRVPTVSDPSLAPDGHHVVSVLVHFVPTELGDDAKDALGDAVLERLGNVRDLVVAREVLTPRDLEERYALTGGHIHHGEHALDQLLSVRPVASCARWATPIRGLYLGGAGSHPGGGVSGMPGYLAAQAMMSK